MKKEQLEAIVLRSLLNNFSFFFFVLQKQKIYMQRLFLHARILNIKKRDYRYLYPLLFLIFSFHIHIHTRAIKQGLLITWDESEAKEKNHKNKFVVPA